MYILLVMNQVRINCYIGHLCTVLEHYSCCSIHSITEVSCYVV